MTAAVKIITLPVVNVVVHLSMILRENLGYNASNLSRGFIKHARRYLIVFDQKSFSAPNANNDGQ